MNGRTRFLLALLLGTLLAVAALGVAAAQSGSGASQTAQNYGQMFLDRLAQILGIDRARLDSAIQQANSQVIDQAERNGDLSRNQADALRERMVLGEGAWLGPGPWHGGWHHGWGWRGGWAKKALWNTAVLDAAAGALGITRDELVTQLQEGKTLGEVADARGVDRQKVRDAVVAAYTQRLDSAVQNGALSREQADRLLERFQSADITSATLGRCRGWWGGGSSGGGSSGSSGSSGTTGTSNSL